MQRNNRKTAEALLFTGAGFTHNFGGLLADQMWAEIFNHPEIQTSPFARELMLQDHSYESVYHKILFNTPSYFQERDQLAIKSAIREAYQRLDQELQGPQDVDALRGLDQLIYLFRGYPDDDEIHYFFTLNQDLLIERNTNRWKTALSHPGLSMKHIARAEITEDDFVVLPKAEDL